MVYASEYAQAEVEAARELLNDRNERFVARPGDFQKRNEDEKITRSGVPGEGEIKFGRTRLRQCGLCAALTTRDGQRTHERWHLSCRPERPRSNQTEIDKGVE